MKLKDILDLMAIGERVAIYWVDDAPDYIGDARNVPYWLADMYVDSSAEMGYEASNHAIGINVKEGK